MNIGLLLSGCGVYDGAEIQESIFAMLAIEEMGGKTVCIGIDDKQHHVVNHLTGAEMNESRNMITEAARIARGSITEIRQINVNDLDALVIPGGFGSAKNLTNWAFNGPNGTIREDVKELILQFHAAKKPIVALCVSPVVIAKAFEGTAIHPLLTIGSTQATSPYSISDFNAGIEATSSKTEEALLGEVVLDEEHKIITAPCYMMDAGLLDVKKNISNAMNVLKSIL